MGSNKEKQAARHEAMVEVANANPEAFAAAMAKAYAKRDLGEYRPRLSAEERAAAKAEAAKQANVDKIKALAKKAGIGVLLVDDPRIEEKIAAVQDGTARGVSLDWRDDSEGVAEVVELTPEQVAAP